MDHQKKLNTWIDLTRPISEQNITPVPLTPNKHITIGDLHAHVLKMLQFLIVEGVLEIKDDDYRAAVGIHQKLVHIAQRRLYPTHEEFLRIKRQFEGIMARATVKRVDGLLVRFLGDMLGDRGPNDFLILAVLRRLKEAGVPIEILASNHDIEHIG